MAKNDEKILELLKTIEQKKREIEKAEKPQYRTSCEIMCGHMKYNLHTIMQVNQICDLAAYVLEKKDYFYAAAKLLEVKNVTEWTYGNASFEDWMHDFKVRINKIQVFEEKNKLKLLEDKLKSLMSTEMKTDLELQEIENNLK